jgi:iron-sulfur cluster repair protein YtfE (RIC family)
MTSTSESLGGALEREHREIDEGIEGFRANPSSSQAVAELAAAIRTLRRHIYLEEEFVFPVLSQGGPVAPIFVMLREHAQIWQTLDALEREVAVDNGGLPTVSRLCRQLLVQLLHHNMKEEPVLYPEVDKLLPAEAAARLTGFLETGSPPDGWVCRKARA